MQAEQATPANDVPEPGGELRRFERMFGPFEELWLWLVAWVRAFGASRVMCGTGPEGTPAAYVGPYMLALVQAERVLGASWRERGERAHGEVGAEQGELLLAETRRFGENALRDPVGIIRPWRRASVDPRRVPALLHWFRQELEIHGAATPDELDLDAVTNAFGPMDRLFELVVRHQLLAWPNPCFGAIDDRGTLEWGPQPLEPLRLICHPRGVHEIPMRHRDEDGAVWKYTHLLDGPAVTVWEDGWCVGAAGPWWRYLGETFVADVCAGLVTLIDDLRAEES